MQAAPASDSHVETIIDARPIGRLQVVTIILCACIAVIDGFDTQSIAFVAPVIAKAWSIDVASFGPVFGAGLLGLTVGALVLGPAADRFGRKPLIIVSILIFAIGSLVTAFVASTNELMLFRLLTGLGLGGVMPNIIALTAEYAPRRNRALVVTTMFCGFPVGAVVGGLASTGLIPAFGWPSVFIAGGILPIVLLPAILAWLPESIRFLAAHGRQSRASTLLARIDPNASIEGSAGSASLLSGSVETRAGVLKLFTPERRVVTLLLWIAFFCNLLIMYFLINWLPAVLQRTGVPLERAIIATVLLNAGGIAGGLFISKLVDRYGPRLVLTLAYISAAGTVAAIGAGWASTGALLAVVCAAGFSVIGAQYGMNAFAAAFYPTELRSTGVGAAFGIGRIGSIVGPVVGGVLLSMKLDPDRLFHLAAAPAILAALAIFIAGRWRAAAPVTPVSLLANVEGSVR